MQLKNNKQKVRPFPVAYTVLVIFACITATTGTVYEFMQYANAKPEPVKPVLKVRNLANFYEPHGFDNSGKRVFAHYVLDLENNNQEFAGHVNESAMPKVE